MLSALEPHTQPAALIDRLRKQRPEIYPNPLMMLHADRLLGRNGALIQAVNAYHQHQIRAWEIRMADPATREQLGLRMEGDPTTT